MAGHPRLDALVREKYTLSWGKARDHIESGKISVNGAAVRDPGAPTDPAAVIELRMNAPRAKASAQAQAPHAAPRVVFSDTQVLVVSKPSGLNSVPFEDEPGPSLEKWACAHLKQPKVHIVQRLDRETSGLMVLARTAEAGRALAQQFRFRDVHRRYLAIVQGDAQARTIRSVLLDNRGDGLRGSRPEGSPIASHLGKEAVTHVRVVARLEGSTLVECELESGRTHQIRIHLSEAGHPLLGERAYIREFRGETLPAPRIMLHAAELGFNHPTRGQSMQWRERPPEDFLRLLTPHARELVTAPATRS